MKLETVNDIDCLDSDNRYCDKEHLKQLVIKWVKEDIANCNYHVEEKMINKWIRRLNITEDDLK